jgi:hypothetical protein
MQGRRGQRVVTNPLVVQHLPYPGQISSIPDKKLLKALEVPFYRTYQILNLK